MNLPLGRLGGTTREGAASGASPVSIEFVEDDLSVLEVTSFER